jgi:hypothetical protein
MTPTRRTLVTMATGALVVSAAPAAIAAPADDQTFTLLDAHAKSEARVRALPEPAGDPTLGQQLSEASIETQEMAWDIAKHQPASLAGCIAVLRYVSDNGSDGERWFGVGVDEAWLETLHANLARALERIARTA